MSIEPVEQFFCFRIWPRRGFFPPSAHIFQQCLFLWSQCTKERRGSGDYIFGSQIVSLIISKLFFDLFQLAAQDSNGWFMVDRSVTPFGSFYRLFVFS